MNALAAMELAFVSSVFGGRDRAPELRDPVRAAAGTGLRIYAEAYALRLLEALRNDFPGLLRLAGDAGFERLGRAYVAAHPSRHFNLRWFGKDLAAFLRQEAPWRERPDLSDLAAFEWAEGEAFDAADAPALDASALSTVAPEAWSALAFDLHPSLRRLDVTHDVGTWIEASDDDAAAPPSAPGAATWIFWRRDLDILRRKVETDEASALGAVAAGRPFGEICETLARHVGESDAPARAAGLLRVWFDAGLIAGLRRA
jgi:hypothetical protein